EPGLPAGVQLVLGLRLAFELAEVDLLEARVEPQLTAGERDPRRLDGASQRARVDHGLGLETRDVGGEALRLLPALAVQLDVGDALEATRRVPIGQSVPHERQAQHVSECNKGVLASGMASGSNDGGREVALVTGASRGIGLAVAEALLREGF